MIRVCFVPGALLLYYEVFMKETVDLGGGYTLLQPRGVYPCGTDAVLLAAFTAENGAPGRFCDLCAGSGVVPILVCKRRPDVSFAAVEISDTACRAAEENAEANGLSGRMTVTRGDVKAIGDIFEAASFDCVTVNPPYMKAGAGKAPADERLRAAVQETLCTAADVISAAAFLLRGGGSLFIVHRAERMDEILRLMRENGLCPRLIRPVFHSTGAKRRTFLAQAVKGGSGEAEEKPLILYENGAYTEEAARIYGG